MSENKKINKPDKTAEEIIDKIIAADITPPGGESGRSDNDILAAFAKALASFEKKENE